MGQKPPMARKAKTADRVWTARVLAVLAAAAVLRLALNAMGLVPVHFDEAQYWTYGLDPDLGYYSKPPLSAWMIRAQTELLGVTAFALRVSVPLIHLWIGWLIYATGRRLYDARTGFWAAAGYTLAPGVTASAALMTTDPPMMMGWAIALYALVRAMMAGTAKKPAPAPGWWLAVGLALGLGMLSKYTALVFAGGALGYALVSRAGPWRAQGPAIAAAGLLAMAAPHLVWLAGNGFVSVTHLAENAGEARGLTPLGTLEFLGAQAGVIGPVFLLAILAAAWPTASRRADWRWRLLAWVTLPLILAMCVQALRGGANVNWAAPSYIAGSIMAAHWLLARGWVRGLQLQLGIGVAAAALLWGATAVYTAHGTGLPRLPDPMKKMRIAGPLCERAVVAMEETGAETILSDDRRRLAECAWVAGLMPDQMRVWNPSGQVANHYEMTVSLRDGETGPMVLVLLGDRSGPIAPRFGTAERLDAGEIRTHSDRAYPFEIWFVDGFRGYSD